MGELPTVNEHFGESIPLNWCQEAIPIPTNKDTDMSSIEALASKPNKKVNKVYKSID